LAGENYRAHCVYPLKKITYEECESGRSRDQGSDDHDYEVRAHAVHTHGISAHEFDQEESYTYEWKDQDNTEDLPDPIQGIKCQYFHGSLLCLTML